MLKCYERIDKSNIFNSRENRREEEIESFEEYFAYSAKLISEKHNFDELIKAKKESEKIRMIREI